MSVILSYDLALAQTIAQVLIPRGYQVQSCLVTDIKRHGRNSTIRLPLALFFIVADTFSLPISAPLMVSGCVPGIIHIQLHTHLRLLTLNFILTLTVTFASLFIYFDILIFGYIFKRVEVYTRPSPCRHKEEDHGLSAKMTCSPTSSTPKVR